MNVEIKMANQETISDVLPLINKAEKYFSDMANKSRLPEYHEKEYNYQEVPLEYDESILLNHMVFYAVYTSDGGDEVVVGCVTFCFDDLDTNHVFLNHLYVDECFRRKGVGQRLAAYSINTAHEKGCHVEFGILNDNQDAKKFWDSFFHRNPIVTVCPICTTYYIAH